MWKFVNRTCHAAFDAAFPLIDPAGIEGISTLLKMVKNRPSVQFASRNTGMKDIQHDTTALAFERGGGGGDEAAWRAR